MQQQLIDFAMNHWMILTAFVLIAAYLVYSLLQGDKGSVDPMAATEMINHQRNNFV